MTTVSSPIEAMLFDLDGTLLDTAADFIYVVQQLCRENNQPAPDSEAINRTVSSGARALVQLAFGIDPEHPQCQLLHQRLLEIYALQIQESHAVLYPGMQELLDSLQRAGIPWGIVTNKPEAYAVPLLERTGIAKHCGVLVCPQHVRFPKPHPEPVLLACRRINRLPAATVYVGDHPRDIDSGRAAGTFTIAAAYGYLEIDPPIKTWGADMIVDSVREITRWWPEALLPAPAAP